MKNLEQIRAQNAFTASKSTVFKGEKGGQVVKKVPTMIRENGFIAALAFAMEKKEGYLEVFEKMLAHLNDSQVRAITDSSVDSPEKLLAYACAGDASRLRDLTAESMAYLSYLRRFALKGEGANQ